MTSLSKPQHEQSSPSWLKHNWRCLGCVALIARHSSLIILCLLSSCAVTPSSTRIIYALPMQDGIATPLGRALGNAAETLHFTHDRYTLTKAQQQTLQSHLAAWESAAHPLLIVATASRKLPPDYARVLAERRAKSVRQALIEAGMNPALLHTTSLGNDAPTFADGDIIAIFQNEPKPTPPASPEPKP